MKLVELKTDPTLLARGRHGLVPLAQAIQAASRGRVFLTLKGLRLDDANEGRLKGIDARKALALLSKVIEHPLRPGAYPLEVLLGLSRRERSVEKLLEQFYRHHLPFVAEDVVSRLEGCRLKVFMLGSAGTGVVSATQDMVSAFANAGYYGRAFPVFDPSKKGAPVKGYGVVSR